MNIICEIQQKYNNFSDKEKAIANYILHQPDMIKNINIIELAKITGTSSSTITRFSKKIGCDSFVEMKMQINLSTNDNNFEEGAEVENKFQTALDKFAGKVWTIKPKNIDPESPMNILAGYLL